MVIPHIGRMDDIWAAYYIQQKFKRLLPFIVFSSSSVYQNRNVHNYVLDLKKEIIGYEKTIFFKNQKVKSFLPKSCLKLINLYRDFFI